MSTEPDHPLKLRRLADEERRKAYDLMRDCGCTGPVQPRWSDAVIEAIHEIRERRLPMSLSAISSEPLPTTKMRTRVVPSDRIPIAAEDIVGMQVALHQALARVHELEADRAERIIASIPRRTL